MYNHYSKLTRIINSYPDYKIIRINEPTTTKRFNGEYNYYDHYYRLIDVDGQHLKYGKFQQLDKLADYLNVPVEELLAKVINDD